MRKPPKPRRRMILPSVMVQTSIEDGVALREDLIDRDPGGAPIKRAAGKAVPRTPEMIAVLAKATPRDRDRAVADWKAKTLPESRGMIEAERED